MKREVHVVTGANGLLGRSVVRRLAAAGDVHAIVREVPSDPVPGVRYYSLDISRPFTPESLPAAPDSVIHLAQSPHFRDFPTAALDVFGVNVAATALFLDYAYRSGAKRFVQASSGGVYGARDTPFSETDKLALPSELGHYLATKLAGEALAMSYAERLQVKVLRFFFIYGRDQNRTMLLPRLVDNVTAGRPISVQGVDGLRLNPIHVADASLAVERCLTHQGSATFNVGGDEALSLRELVNKIACATGRQAVFLTQAGLPRHTVGDITAMRRELCAPAVSLDAGLSDLFA